MSARKCRKCSEKAAIHMRQHRLALCKDHFLEWMVEQTERFIEKYKMFTRQEKVLLAVSGGKDSLSLWDILWRLGYNSDGLYINLGITGQDDYSDDSGRYAKAFADERGLKLHVVDVKQEYGESIPELAGRSQRGKDRPCGVCGLVKRHVMNRLAHQSGYDVLVTAHNLDDEAALLFGNVLAWSVDMLQRQGNLLKEAPGFARKAKPFCRFYERETAAYAILRPILYKYEECPFSVGSKQLYYKDLLNRLEEETPGAKLQFYLRYLKAKSEGFFGAVQEPEDGDRYALRCPHCGQPTISEGPCAFCRLVRAGLPAEDQT